MEVDRRQSWWLGGELEGAPLLVCRCKCCTSVRLWSGAYLAALELGLLARQTPPLAGRAPSASANLLITFAWQELLLRLPCSPAPSRPLPGSLGPVAHSPQGFPWVVARGVGRGPLQLRAHDGDCLVLDAALRAGAPSRLWTDMAGDLSGSRHWQSPRPHHPAHLRRCSTPRPQRDSLLRHH